MAVQKWGILDEQKWWWACQGEAWRQETLSYHKEYQKFLDWIRYWDQTFKLMTCFSWKKGILSLLWANQTSGCQVCTGSTKVKGRRHNPTPARARVTHFLAFGYRHFPVIDIFNWNVSLQVTVSWGEELITEGFSAVPTILSRKSTKNTLPHRHHGPGCSRDLKVAAR